MYFHISKIRDVVFQEPLPLWAKDGVMAAAPLKSKKGYRMLFRGFTKAEPVTFSRLGYASGTTPFELAIRQTPLLSPGSKGTVDELGVEDPTVARVPGGDTLVLFSQVRPKGEASTREGLGVFVSIGAAQLTRRGLTGKSTLHEPTQQGWWEQVIDMCKEAEILFRPKRYSDHDVLFYEFGDGRCSRIAAAKTDLQGRSTEKSVWDSRLWIHPRAGMWDNNHVSTGPIIAYKDKRLMFYNGRSSGRVWAIGEVLFDPQTLEILKRSEQPLIEPTEEIGWDNQRIAFSSGAFIEDDTVYLYYHEADRRIRCAVGTLKP